MPLFIALSIGYWSILSTLLEMHCLLNWSSGNAFWKYSHWSKNIQLIAFKNRLSSVDLFTDEYWVKVSYNLSTNNETYIEKLMYYFFLNRVYIYTIDGKLNSQWCYWMDWVSFINLFSDVLFKLCLTPHSTFSIIIVCCLQWFSTLTVACWGRMQHLCCV